MKKILLLLCLIFLISETLFSADGYVRGKRDYNWLSRGEYNSNMISFKNPGVEPKLIEISDKVIDDFLSWTSDRKGNLLFATSKHYIYNRNFSIMDTLSSTNDFDNDFRSWLKYFGIGHSLIIPKPEDDNIFYMFYQVNWMDCLFYSIVDMSGNGGFGKVIGKHIMLTDSNDQHGRFCGGEGDTMVGDFTALMHENKKDVWLVSLLPCDTALLIHPINKKGIQKPFIQKLSNIGMYYNYSYFRSLDGRNDDGISHSSNDSIITFVADNKDRDINFTLFDDYIVLVKFDNSTGKILKQLNIPIYDCIKKYLRADTLLKDSLGIGSIEFSPDSKKLYFICFINPHGYYQPNNLYQIDLEDFEVNKIVESTVQLHYEKYVNDVLRRMRLAPDGKIYFNSKWNYFSAISNPNLKGLDCQIVDSAFNHNSGLFFNNYYNDWQIKYFNDYNYVELFATAETPVCEGEKIRLDVDMRYESDTTYYEWSGPAGFSSNMKNPIITNAKPENTGWYYLWCYVEGLWLLDSINVTVNPSPKARLKPSGTVSICEGTSLTITTEVVYNAYTWSNSRYTQEITVDSVGEYYVQVRDSNGCWGISDTVFVKFAALPKPKVSGDLSFCFNENTILSTDANYMEIKWNTEETTREITVSQAGKYWYWARDENGCEGWSDTVEVVELPQVKVEVEGKREICPGETTTLQTTEEYSSYKWSSGEETRQIKVSKPGVYSVEVTDENGCKAKAEVEVKTIEIVLAGTEEIDFGNCKLKKECSITRKIKNNTDKTIRINKLTQTGDSEFLYTTTPSLPATLEPEQELTLEVRFTPQEKRAYSAIFAIDIDQPCMKTVETVARGTGEGISGKLLVWLTDTSASVGEKDFCIPLFARLETDESVSNLEYTAIISFNANALITNNPNKGTVISNERTITLTGNIPEISKDEIQIGKFCGDILLADKALLPLKIEQFEISENIDKETRDGSLKLLFCQVNLAAINYLAPTQAILKPNPASDELYITITSEETGQFSLEIYSITGNLLEKRHWSGSGKQVSNFKLDLSNFSNGIYQAVITSPSGRMAEQVRVVR